MDIEIKCSFEEHKEIKAISYCLECRNYMCNKCEKTHSSFIKNHHSYNINKEDEMFSGYCKEKNHQLKLEYFCKNHNQLCCVACIAKLNEKGEGQHKDCDVCYIEKIKYEKKNKLKENIKLLEVLEKQLNESIESMKKIFEEIEKNKEGLKSEIQNIFTKIRNILNEREVELLSEIDHQFNIKFINEDIIKKREKLPKQIKLSIEKGKSIDKEWDDKKLYSYINDCINIENNIKVINSINDKVNKSNLNKKIQFNFFPKENQLESITNTIKTFGKIFYNNKYSFKECPKNISDERKYIVTGDSKNVITKTGTDKYFMGTILENELDKSIEEHKWKIKILKTLNKYIMIGVAPIDFNISSSFYTDCGWYLYCSSPPALYSGPPFKYSHFKTNLSEVKDEAIVIFNYKKRSLKFIINDEDKGDSFINIPIDKPLVPAVFLYNKDDSVEINQLF